MKSHYKRLGDYIREVNVRNRDLSVTKLLGVSIQKVFMPSIANTIGTDMVTYKIVEKGQFGYGPVTSRNGDKVSIALLTEYDNAIISQAYTVFEVIDREKLLPEYLMMWFRRTEFDRYARFKSHGSAREIFDWGELCDIQLPIPSIDKQREIVAEYEALSRRIAINEQLCDKLEQAAQALYRKMFVDGIDPENLPDGWRMGTLSDLTEITMGQSPEGESYNYNNEGEVFYQGRTDFGVRYPSVRMFTSSPKKMAKQGDVLLSVRAPVGDLNITPCHCCIGRGLASIRSKHKCNSFVFYTLKALSDTFKISDDEGTIFGSINKDDLYGLLAIIPRLNDIQDFEDKATVIDSFFKIRDKERTALIITRNLLLSKLATN